METQLMTAESLNGRGSPTPSAPGLECLDNCERVLVRAKKIASSDNGKSTRVLEILNDHEQTLFTALEVPKPGCFSSNFLGILRPFDIAIKDSMGVEVVHLSRPFSFPSVPSFMAVYAPPGALVATVLQQKRRIRKFKVKNHLEECEFEVRRPVFLISCLRKHITFSIRSTTGEEQLGRISKLWTGFFNPFGKDRFVIEFPRQTSPNMKASLIATAFLLDCIYF